MKIRNAHEYRKAEARIGELLDAQRAEFGWTNKMSNELLALGSALDQYELSRAQPRDYAARS